MDTTTIICDTIAVKLNEIAGIGQPLVTDPGTNWQDVIIWVTLFLSVTYIVRYCIKQHFEEKTAERQAIKEDKSDKDSQEQKNRENKLNAEIQKCKNEFQEQLQKRKIQLQDQMLKRKLELQDQLLNHLKEHSKEPTDEKNGANTQPKKEYSDTYTSTLEQAIKDTDNLFSSVLVNDGKEA